MSHLIVPRLTTPLTMRNNSSLIVAGVDIGGSHITAALVDLEQKELIAESFTRAKLNPHGTAEEIIACWSTTLEKLNTIYSFERLGMAMPGPFDYENGVSLIKNQNKYDALYGKNIKTLLGEALSIPAQNILLKNDAACFLQGEVFAGAVKGFTHCIGLTLGTGLGSALYKNNEAENMDLWQHPFKDSIAEDYLSTRWFVQRYFDETGKQINGVKELCLMVDKGAAVKETFDEFSLNLELFLKELIRREKPQAIVIGGNIANAYALFGKAILQTIKEFPHVCIEKAVLGETAAILGAASLCSIADTSL